MVDVVAPTITYIVRRFLESVERLLKDTSSSHSQLEASLSTHLIWADSWCSQTQQFWLAEPLDTTSVTVPLQHQIGSRRIRNIESDEGPLAEPELYSRPGHCVLLGDPGSGKTTTLKRVAGHLLHSEPEDGRDRFRFPICLIARDLGASDLYEAIAERLGLPFSIKYRTPDGVLYDIEPTESSDVGRTSGEKTTRITLIDDRPAYETVRAMLDEGNALLLLDGIDEVNPTLRPRLENQLTELSHFLNRSKIVVSCRSGDYRPLEGFSIYELLPLTEKERHSIATRWMGNPQAFFEELNERPYFELSDRPLFLTYLILLMRVSGHLPTKGVDVYRRVTTLMLEKWDEEQGIERRSQYAQFLPDRKMDFLSEFAFELTFSFQRSSFATELLEVIYKKIHEKYDLPVNQATLVASEIEGHTGLITAIGFEKYSFSHLVLQEYLSARYVVSLRFVRDLHRKFEANPAPFAVAVALASDPTDWFTHFVLARITAHLRSSAIATFLDRLILERVRFENGDLFGIALLVLESQSDGNPKFDIFLEELSCFDSVVLALAHYELSATNENGSHFLGKTKGHRFVATIPSTIKIRESLLVKARKRSLQIGVQISVR